SGSVSPTVNHVPWTKSARCTGSRGNVSGRSSPRRCPSCAILLVRRCYGITWIDTDVTVSVVVGAWALRGAHAPTTFWPGSFGSRGVARPARCGTMVPPGAQCHAEDDQ